MMTRPISFKWLLVAGVLAIGMTRESSAQYIFHWAGRDVVTPGSEIVPIPHSGHDWPADWVGYKNLYATLVSQNLPVGLMLVDDTAPVDGTRDKNTLTTVMSYAPRLDYVMADFEGGQASEEANILAMVSQVRSSPNPAINSARIASYGYYPGAVDMSFPYPLSSDRSERDAFYRGSGLNVAMPDAYPYEYYSVHAESYFWGSRVSPNTRSGLFWAPLEKVSVAARNLPSDHQLIPFVSGFLAWDGYEADPPPREDLMASVAHYRLRGVDSIYMLTSALPPLPDYSEQQYIADVLTAWHSFDALFEGGATPQVLNLGTSKVSGVEWSGMCVGDKVGFEISNLGNIAAAVDLPDIAGLPDWSPMVQPGQHLQLIYTVPEPGALALLGGVLPGLLAYGWRNRKGKQERCKLEMMK